MLTGTNSLTGTLKMYRLGLKGNNRSITLFIFTTYLINSTRLHVSLLRTCQNLIEILLAFKIKGLFDFDIDIHSTCTVKHYCSLFS